MGVLEGHCLRGHPDREPGFQVFRSGAQLDPGWPWVEGLCLSGHLLETDIPRTYQPFLVHNCSKTPLLLILQKKKRGGGRGRGKENHPYPNQKAPPRLMSVSF